MDMESVGVLVERRALLHMNTTATIPFFGERGRDDDCSIQTPNFTSLLVERPHGHALGAAAVAVRRCRGRGPVLVLAGFLLWWVERKKACKKCGEYV